jgi:tetratricopeptide (TPR) repeat protein
MQTSLSLKQRRILAALIVIVSFAGCGTWMHFQNARRQHIQALMQSGELAWEKGELRRAQTIYQEAFQYDPTQSRAASALGSLAAQVDRDQPTARRYFEQARVLDPQDPVPISELATLEFYNRNWDVSKRLYQQTASLDKYWFWPIYQLGRIEEQKGHLDKAIEHYREAHELDTQQAEPLVSLGYVFSKKNQLEEALTYFQAALERAPNDLTALKNSADIYSYQNTPVLAEQMYRRFISIKPREADALYRLGYLLARQKQFDEAAQLFRKVAQIKPRESWSEMGFAFIALQRGDAKSARTHFQRAKMRGIAHKEWSRNFESSLIALEKKTNGNRKRESSSYRP